tara:strand:- start:78 stop:680 length:603 start_codon:yes stop_codon:yes gene_type:complete
VKLLKNQKNSIINKDYMNEPNPQLIKDFSEAEKLSKEKKYQESINKYEIILKKYPNFLPAINNIGLAYEYLGLLDKSIYYYKLCCDKTPKEKIFLNNLGNIYYKKKDYINAIKTFELSYNIDNRQELITEKLANSLVQANFRKQAETFLRRILKTFPNNSFLNTLMGNNLLALSCYKEGLEFLRKGTGFIELNNDSVNII